MSIDNSGSNPKTDGKFLRFILNTDLINRMGHVKRTLMFRKEKHIYEYEMYNMIIARGIDSYEKELGITRPQQVGATH